MMIIVVKHGISYHFKSIQIREYHESAELLQMCHKLSKTFLGLILLRETKHLHTGDLIASHYSNVVEASNCIFQGVQRGAFSCKQVYGLH